MFKFVFPATTLATLALSGLITAQAAPDAASGRTVAASPHQSGSPVATRRSSPLLQIRDVRSGGNGCWNACFNDFEACMGARNKNLCVSRVKTCLETCDRLSNRPGM